MNGMMKKGSPNAAATGRIVTKLIKARFGFRFDRVVDPRHRELDNACSPSRSGMLEYVIEDRLHVRQARSIDLGYFETDALGDSVRDVQQINRVETQVVSKINIRREIVACEIGGDIENQPAENFAQALGSLRLL
jgi:hypothetical protein